ERTWAPKMIRLRTSRPSRSVPNGYSHVPPANTGGSCRIAGLIPSGSCGTSRWANSATMIVIKTMVSGISGRRLKVPRVWVKVVAMSLGPHARIDQAVADVHEEIDADDDRCVDEYRKLKDGEVTP